MRCLIALQFYPGDQKAAYEVSRLIADIEPEKRNDVDFLFAGRFDVEHDESEKMYVARRFKVYEMTSRRTETGWPAGPNALWPETMTWACINARDKKIDWDFVLTIESDVVPLRKTWLNELMNEWRLKQKEIVGHLIVSRHPWGHEHINGNMMVDTRIIQKLPQLSGSPFDCSWDCYHSISMSKHWAHTDLIHSMHHLPTITKEELYKQRGSAVPCMFHGVKDASARTIARKEMGL